MTRGDLPDVVAVAAADHVPLVASDGEPTVERVTAQLRTPHRRHGRRPGCGWSRSTAARWASCQDYRIARLPRVRRAHARTRTRSASTTRSASRTWVGRGFGVRHAVGLDGASAPRRYRDATAYFAAPDHRNEASLRVLDKVGFVRGHLVRRAAAPTAPPAPWSAARSTSARVVGPTDAGRVRHDARHERRCPAASRSRRPARASNRRRARASTATRRPARRRWPRWATSWPTCRSGSSRRGRARARGAACCWCCRAWTPPARAACCATRSGLIDPQGVADHLVQGADRGGARPRLPVADQAGAARSRVRRRLRPLPLRGRADRPGPRAGADPRRSSAATTRSTSSRPGWPTRAPRSSSACCTSPPTSRRSGCWPGSTTRRSTGSSTPATSTSAALWPDVPRRPTRSRSSAPTPRSRRGT